MRPTSRFISALALCALAAVGRPAPAAGIPKDPDKLSPAQAVDAWLAVVEADNESFVRRNYAEGRIVTLGKAAMPRLLDLWKTASDDRRGTLAEIFGVMPDLPKEGLAALMDELRSRGGSVHPHVVRALADRNEAAAGPLMLAAWPKANDEVRLALLSALGRLGDENAAEVLLPALDSSDRLVRITASDGIARVLAALRVSTDAKKKDIYAKLFRKALDYVENGPTFESRRVLACGLGLVGDADASRLLLRLLRAGEVEMRIAAAGSLGRIECHAAVDDLAEAARSEDPILRRTALDALIAINDPACLPALVEVLAECAPKERRDVLRVLQHIAGQPLGDNPDQWRKWLAEKEKT